MCFFFFNDTATTEIYTLSLHDALPILTIRLTGHQWWWEVRYEDPSPSRVLTTANEIHIPVGRPIRRSEEHTSELQSRQYLVCRLLLEKKKKNIIQTSPFITLSHHYLYI